MDAVRFEQVQRFVLAKKYLGVRCTLKNDHGLETIGDLTKNFSVLKKCNGKLDCLIYEMFWINKIRPYLNTQSDSMCAKLFILSLFTCIFYVLSPRTVYIKLSNLKMMTWSHRNVVSNSFRLLISSSFLFFFVFFFLFFAMFISSFTLLLFSGFLMVPVIPSVSFRTNASVTATTQTARNVVFMVNEFQTFIKLLVITGDTLNRLFVS